MAQVKVRCNSPIAASKPKKARLKNVDIRAVQNGYKVRVDENDSWRGISFSVDDGKWNKLPATPTEYVFPDFATLTAWLRKNITHGGGVES